MTARTVCFGAWFTDAEDRRIRRAAAREGQSPSEWIRATVLYAVCRPGAGASLELPETVPPEMVARVKAELLAVMPHALGGRARPEHDANRCPECLSLRVRKLVKRGLGVPVARELRDAGTLAAAMVTQLEAASDDQLNEVNAAWARQQRAREEIR